MDSETAEKLMEQYRKFGDWFNEATRLTMSIADQETAKRVRRAAGEMLFLLQDAIVVPVQQVFSELVREDESET